MTEQIFDRFKKVLSKYINKINIDGITFSMTKYTDQKRIGGVDVQVPLIKIHNTKNVPFSYNSLHDLFTQQLEVVNTYANTEMSFNQLELSFVFDDFQRNEFYIPKSIENRLKRCLNSEFVYVKFRDKNNIIYTMEIKYIVDSNFDLYWDDIETFKLDISLLCKSIFVDNLITGKHYIMDDKEEMTRLVYDIRYDDPYIFENPIWPCFEDTLHEYSSFINREWQYMDVNVIVI